MAGDEVGVEMGLDDVLDAEAFFASEVEVEVDVALGVDDGGDAFGCHDVGGVGEAAKEELLDEYGFHVFPLGAVYWKEVVSCQVLVVSCQFSVTDNGQRRTDNLQEASVLILCV